MAAGSPGVRRIVATRRLAVLGSPIGHSRSPALHRAAYDVLGLDWSYEAADVAGSELAAFVEGRDESWLGLSLTMPLKRDILPLLSSRNALVDQTGSANTVLFTPGGLAGFNTDVYGITGAFARHGVDSLRTVLVVGGGATAASALVAAARLGAHRVFIAVRSVERAAPIVGVGRAQGIEVDLIPLTSVATLDERLDAVISTVPNGTDAVVEFDRDTVVTATLLDVAYHPWPSPLAQGWSGAGTISGLEMLVLQALAQVRIFVNHDDAVAVADEDRVLAAMLESVGL